MKKSFLILLPFLLAGCGEPKTENNVAPIPDPNPQPQPQPEPQPEPDPEPTPGPQPAPTGEYTKTIKLSGNEFTSFANDSGKQINNTDHSREKGELLTYLRSKVDYETMVSEIDCVKLNTALWDVGTALCVGTGYYLNNKFSEGTFKWCSDVKIYHVEVKARAYTKDNQGTIQVDEPAKIQIDNGEIKPLIEDGETTPFVKSFVADYPDGADCFTINSYDARVLIEEVTINWKV